MADNFSEMNNNFDTIKTMLNSIRAQGILNTSDMDKLLEGINSKLAKINTEEDIERIKVFLAELKKNLDERHEVLISKFGAIESLFSNLMKNSNDTVKSPELKELFDIIATNLSVFSREVVSQKESLTDITLRLDAMRSDDTQKKDIIKSVSTVRNDIEKVNNAFDSIVISLNENFKTVLKTIAEVDQSEAITSFSEKLTDILNSSNTILSAIELIDKKNTQFEDSFDGLATQDDLSNVQKNLVELSAKSDELVNLVDMLTQKSYKIDNLAEKIDASVNIIAGLKSEIADKDDSVRLAVLDKLAELETTVRDVSSIPAFEEFRSNLENLLNGISTESEQLKSSIDTALSNISNLNDDVQALNIGSSFENIASGMVRVGEDIKEKVISEADKISQMMEVNITRTLNDISSNAEVLNTRIKDSHSTISNLCEKSFSEVSESISGLKEIVAQIDENNVSANNAIFSNITDRLAIFENSLKTSLEKQEDYVSGSSVNVIEQIANMKNVTEGIEYKLDANAIELGNAKREFEQLSESVNQILAMDFVNEVKNFKVDLYAVKQDLATALDTAQSDLSEKYTNDLFGKYELLISKLDSVEDEVKYAQADALNGLKTLLNNISESIMDVLSYVSSAKEDNNEAIEAKLNEVTTFIQDSNLNYIENVRDIVDVIRTQVESNLRQISEESDGRFKGITNAINDAGLSVKQDIKVTYDKLFELQNNIETIRNELNSNNDGLSNNIKNILDSTDSLKGDFDYKLNALKNSLLDKVSEFKNDFTCENADNISELKFNAENLHSRTIQKSVDLKNELKDEVANEIESLKVNILNLNELISNTTLRIEGANKDVINFVKNDFTSEINNSVDSIKSNTAEVLTELDNKVIEVVGGFNKLDSSVNNLSKETTNALSGTLAKILDNFVSLNSSLVNFDEKSAERMKENADELKKDFDIVKRKITEVDSQIDEDLARQINIIEGSFESLNLMLVDIMNQATDSLGEKIKKELSGAANQMGETLAEELEQYKIQIEELFEGLQGKNDEQAEFIKRCALELNEVLKETLDKQNKDSYVQLEEIGSRLKDMIHENVELTAADYESLKVKLDEFNAKVAEDNNVLVDSIRAQLDDIAKFVDSNLDIHSQEVNSTFDEISSSVQKVISTVRDFGNELEPKVTGISSVLEEEIKPSVSALSDKLESLFEDNMVKFVTQYSNSNSQLSDNITSKIVEFKTDFVELKNKLASEEDAREEFQQAQVSELNARFNEIVSEIKKYVKSEFAAISDTLNSTKSNIVNDINNNVGESLVELSGKIESIKESSNINKADINSSIEEKTAQISSELEGIKNDSRENRNVLSDLLNTQVDSIIQGLESVKNNSKVCKDLISNLVNEYSKNVSKEIEKETDIIVGEMIEQFELIKNSQKDELSNLTVAVEGSISDYIIDALNDLKQYLDVKIDKASIDAKLDTLRNELSKSIDDTTENINKLLEVSVFSDAITDLKTTNNILINTMTDKLNSQIQNFVRQNITDKMDEKFGVLDKKFVDTIVDKYEEVKLLSIQHNKSIENIFDSLEGLLSKLADVKDGINSNIKSLEVGLNSSVNELKESFADLKAQIMNKSFDEAFHASVQNQISGIETLVKEQMEYLEDINDLCGTNLPELTEMNTIVKHGIQNSISSLSAELKSQGNNISAGFSIIESGITKQKSNISDGINELKSDIAVQEANITKGLDSLKSDIITQFINIFNQISFVTEQEEILDFIDEKHSELITILSHIVTTTEEVKSVKDNLISVDNKIDSLKEDIDLINEKITSIMSSEGDIDYVYSLQDLESDIANLRLALNDMKADNKSKEFEELINSTNNIYQIVETIKSELPKFETEEFKKDFNNLAEDIVSISTRTNKLILTSDESYKTLQDNLQDFKLVIDDLDERTRNFAKESGIDKLDHKLGAINTMIQNGAKTNQVFNQVFEYLAEWVDKAGEQITAISDKVETLDDIGQIKIMLEDLRAESHDSTNSNELVEALEAVFEKQAKRIASLEAKIDKIIVNSNVNSKNSKANKPIEDTLNKFLSAIGDNITAQQEKINSLESKLEEVVSLIDNKDTIQLTKKVGGMDRQLAKLNKSIEKIASNVVEK